MDPARLAREDLNLLVHLDALLNARSVTGAATSLGLSQPTLSASLAKLRRVFDDDLLHRVGNAYVLTPLAVQLIGRVATAFEAVGKVYDGRSAFDPTQVAREFTMLASDYATATIGGRAADLLQAVAPRASLKITRFDLPSVMLKHDQLVQDVDALLIPHGYVSDLEYVDVYSDNWSAIVASDNHSVGEELSIEDVADLSWCVTYREAAISSAAEWSLRLQGVEVNAAIVVDSLLALPALVEGSSRAAFIPSRMVPAAVAGGGVRVVGLPLEPSRLVEALWWIPARTEDPMHSWFRGIVTEAGRLISE